LKDITNSADAPELEAALAQVQAEDAAAVPESVA